MSSVRPPRVLQVIDSLWPGGAERLMPVLVGELHRSGEAVPIVRVVGDGDNADPVLERTVREASQDFAFTGRHKLYDPALVRKLGTVIRRHRIDVVHSHLNISNVSTRIASALLGVPHVATVHLPPDQESEDASRRVWADGLTARLSTRVVGVSPHTAEGYAARFRIPSSRVRVIPNGTAPRPVSVHFDRDATRRELVGAVEAPIVLCAARLEERKGIADLIRAASLLRERVPGVHVVVAGKGPDEDRLRRLIAAEGSGSFVHLIGFRDDVGDLFASADVLCLPSYIEGLPVSLLEAMHAGLVCVATDVGGTPFVVRDGETGLLVRPADPAGLAAALARVLTDETLRDRLARAARSMVQREFTPQTMASGYAALYREVMSGGRRA